MRKKFASVVFELCEWTDRQTDTPPGGKYNQWSLSTVHARLLLLLLMMLMELLLVRMLTWYGGVLGVVSFVDDLRRLVVVDELGEVVAAVRASVGRVLDRRSSGADELLQVGLGRQTALLHATR